MTAPRFTLHRLFKWVLIIGLLLMCWKYLVVDLQFNQWAEDRLRIGWKGGDFEPSYLLRIESINGPMGPVSDSDMRISGTFDRFEIEVLGYQLVWREDEHPFTASEMSTP